MGHLFSGDLMRLLRALWDWSLWEACPWLTDGLRMMTLHRVKTGAFEVLLFDYKCHSVLLLLFGLHMSPQWNMLSYLLKTQALSRRHKNNLWHILFAVTEHWPVIFNPDALIWLRQTNRVDTHITLGDGFYATPASFKKVLAAEGINGLYPFRL